MRPFQFQDDYVDIQDIQRLAQDVPPSLGHYCKVKFKHSFSLTPTYKIFLENKIIFDKEDISYTLQKGQDLGLYDKVVGDIVGISGFIVDPFVFLILIVFVWTIIKNQKVEILLEKLKKSYLSRF